MSTDPPLIKEPDIPIVIDEKAKEDQRNIIADAKRDRREKDSVHWAFVILIWIAILSVAGAFGVRTWHIIVSPKYCWLDEAHLKAINDFLTTGVFSGGVGLIFKSKISKP